MISRIHTVPGVHREAKNRPAVVFIPGGPGLSSSTLRSMDILSRSFDLFYVDPPGTGGLEEPTAPTFEGVVASISEALSPIGRPMFVCGHSFGALYAVALAERGGLPVQGLIAMASPHSKRAYALACELFEKYMTPELKDALEVWDKERTPENLVKSYAAYGRLYFAEGTVGAGQELFLRDLVSQESSVRLLPVLSAKDSPWDFVKMAAGIALPKLMLAGGMDLLFPPEALQEDAREMGAEFRLIHEAGHFLTFDCPEAVAGAIEENILATARR